MAEFTHEVRECVLLAEVFAVTRRVLRDEYQLLDASFGQTLRLGHDRAEAAASEVAAHLRNEAEGARAVAALGNLDVCEVRGRGEHARRRVVVEIRRRLVAERQHRKLPRVDALVGDLSYVADLARADEGVNFGHL